MKLTDFDRAQVRAIESEYWSYDGPGLMYAVRKLLSVIDHLSQEPEVVRCGECTNGKPVYAPQSSYLDPPVVEGILCYRDMIVKDFTDFCSYGERRKEPDDG